MIVVMNVPGRDIPEGLFGQVAVCTDLHHSGALPTAIDALAMGLDSPGPVTILQDDIRVCRNFVPYLERFLPYIENRQQIVKWFDPGMSLESKRPRLSQRTPETFAYTQAVTYSSHWAKKILHFLKALAVLDNPPPIHGDDNWICEALKAYGQNYYIHRPSLVQHIGRKSFVAPGLALTDARIAHDFIGLDVDPLDWPTVTFNLL